MPPCVAAVLIINSSGSGFLVLVIRYGRKIKYGEKLIQTKLHQAHMVVPKIRYLWCSRAPNQGMLHEFSKALARGRA